MEIYIGKLASCWCLIVADNPRALKEVDKAEDFDVNRS